jgi:hypothetical protein
MQFVFEPFHSAHLSFRNGQHVIEVNRRGSTEIPLKWYGIEVHITGN